MLLSLAFRNLWRNRRRTLITLAAIALSIMLVQAFHNLSVGVYARMIDDGVRAGSGHLAVYRQGYLDGEDQKTLISFVLYGDPLYISGAGRVSLSGKAVIRRTTRPAEIRTACALTGDSSDGPAVDEASNDRVRSIVSHYLPGMTDARAAVHRQHCGCTGEGHTCPTSQIGSKQMGHAEPGTTVVTLSKSVAEGE